MPMGLPPWKVLWPLALVLSVVTLGSCARRHRLWVPANHVALSGDVTVEFQQPRDDVSPDGVLQLLDLAGSEPRAERSLPGQTNGNISFPCSYFDHAGEFEVRMLRESGGEVLAASSVINVDWPPVELMAPSTHQALVGGIAVTITTTANLCTDMQYNRYENSVVLLYHDLNRTLTEAERVTFSHGNVVVERVTGLLMAVNLEQFDCTTLDRAGIYSFLFCSSYRRSILGASPRIDVTWSDTYRVTFPRETVLPCPDTTSVDVSFDAPSCRGDRDKIRVYGETGRFELRPTGTLEYITEVTALGSFSTFDCSHFSRNHVGYCFVYVSTAKSGAVYAHRDRILCVPVDEIGPPLDGSWSDWSDWGACTVTCGPGQRNRFRLCNNPPATNGGALCVGETVVSQPCNYGFCPVPKDPVEIVTEPTVQPGCICGCTLRDNPGGVIASSPADCTSPASAVEEDPLRAGSTGTGDSSSVDGQVLTWLVLMPAYKRVRLEFKSFNLHLQEEWMRIRDGGDGRAKVLAYHTGSRLPAVVVSTGNQLYIEYKVYSGGVAERGFRARYSSLDGGIPPTTPMVAGSTGEETASGLNLGSINNTVMMVGIFLCAGIIFISVIITILTGCKKKKSPTEIELRPNPGPGSSIASASGQRPWGPPGHSCSSQSEMSHQSGKRGRPDGHLGDRSQLYMVQDEGLAYLPESNVSLSSPYRTHSSDTIGMRRPPKIPEDKLPSPYHPHRTDFIQMERLRKVGLPYHIGNGSSQSELSRHSGKTDKNTTTLATKTPDFMSMRGYSAAGSQASFEQKYGSLPRSDRHSDHRHSDHRHSDHRHSDHKHSDHKHSDHRSDHHHSDHRSDHKSDHGFDSNLPCVNREGQLTPLGMALSRNANYNQNEFKSPEGLPHIPEGLPAPSQRPHAPNEGRTSAEINRVGAPGTNRKKTPYNENAVHPVGQGAPQPLVNGDSPTGQRPRKLPLTPRQAFFEDTESLGVVTPMTDISSKDNMQMRSPRSTFSPKRNEVMNLGNRGAMSPLSSPGEHAHGHKNPGNPKRHTDRNNPGSGGRSKRKKVPNTGGSRKTRKSEGKRSSGDEDGRTAAKLALYSTAESDDASATNLLSEPSSPVRHIPELDKKQNTDRLKSVFISDESLAKTFSGGESSRSGMTPRTPRRLPNTPPSGFSPTSNKLKSVLVYSDFSIDQDEPEYDDFIPNLPGTFFENQTPLPTGLSPARKKNLPLKKTPHAASAV